MIGAILFDFGGTLDGDGSHWLDRFNLIYRQIGLDYLPQESIKEAFYWADAQAEADPVLKKSGYRDMITMHVKWQFARLGIDDIRRENEAARAFYEPAQKILRRNRVVLEKLHSSGKRLGVISNFYGNVEILCLEADLSTCLDVILDSNVVGFRKPDPAFFKLALEKLGSKPINTLMVGDSWERDILPARSLGMKTCWITSDTCAEPPDPGHVDWIIHSLEDIIWDETISFPERSL